MSTPIVNPALLSPGIAGPAPTAPTSGPRAPGAGGTGVPASGPSFADVLKGTTAPEPPKFSRHALERLQQRGIDLGGQTLDRLTGGLARAAGKGARNSVIFVDGTAFVASVANNTVITAVSAEHMKDHVFTNIDSAVIA
jgi:flagellar operon protein